MDSKVIDSVFGKNMIEINLSETVNTKAGLFILNQIIKNKESFLEFLSTGITFDSPIQRTVYDAIYRVSEEGKPICYETVLNELIKMFDSGKFGPPQIIKR